MAIHSRGHYAGTAFQIFDALIGHCAFRRPRKRAVVIPKHKRRPVVDGGGNIMAAVCIFTLAGDKDIAGADFTAI